MSYISKSICTQIVIETPSSNDNGFYVRMQDDAMQDAGIYENDLLRVNTAIEACEGDVVLALVDKDLIVRRYFLDQGKTLLMAENMNLPCMILDSYDHFEICGVVEKAADKS
jgi:DNA polymerase V